MDMVLKAENEIFSLDSNDYYLYPGTEENYRCFLSGIEVGRIECAPKDLTSGVRAYVLSVLVVHDDFQESGHSIEMLRHIQTVYGIPIVPVKVDNKPYWSHAIQRYGDELSIMQPMTDAQLSEERKRWQSTSEAE